MIALRARQILAHCVRHCECGALLAQTRIDPIEDLVQLGVIHRRRPQIAVLVVLGPNVEGQLPRTAHRHLLMADWTHSVFCRTSLSSSEVVLLHEENVAVLGALHHPCVSHVFLCGDAS